jgi:hypothetical protein
VIFLECIDANVSWDMSRRVLLKFTASVSGILWAVSPAPMHSPDGFERYPVGTETSLATDHDVDQSSRHVDDLRGFSTAKLLLNLRQAQHQFLGARFRDVDRNGDLLA